MHLFNASSLFNDDAEKEILGIIDNPDKLKQRIILEKEMLLDTYRLKAYNLPEDFTTASYVIASNHLTDSDAPLIMSFYYQTMRDVLSCYPQLFVFAKENCFNGVSIPKQLIPILDCEKVVAVDRTSSTGSIAAIRTAKKWFDEGEKPKHFLIFAQGTIFDINRENPADIERGAFWLARILNIPVLPAFIEQAVEGEQNRLIFGKPIEVPADCHDFEPYKQIWVERVIEAQNNLEVLTGIPARTVHLDAEHQVRKKFAQPTKK